MLTTPVIRCLHNQLPAEIHYLTKSAFAVILTANPYIKQVHTLDMDAVVLHKQLRAERFDFVVDLHKNLRSQIFLLRLGRPYLQFDKLNIKKWLFTSLGLNVLPDKHLVDRYFAALSKRGVHNDERGLDVFIPDSAMDVSEYWTPPEGKPYAVAVLGAAHATKQIPEPLLIDILQKTKFPVVLVGGQREAALGNRLVQCLDRDDIISLAGTLNILQSASIIRQSAVVLTPDTGMMHIAAALNKPILSIWGNTVPAFGMYPYYGRHQDAREIRFEISGLNCRPCSKIGYARCPKGHFKCMRLQSKGLIAATLNRILSESGFTGTTPPSP